MIPIKTPKEVEQMRRACRTASEILERVSELVRPGVTTREVDEAAADFMREAQVKSAFLGYRLGHRVFPGNICISLNDEVVHGIAIEPPYLLSAVGYGLVYVALTLMLACVIFQRRDFK